MSAAVTNKNVHRNLSNVSKKQTKASISNRNKNFLTAFIDESGSITKTDIEHNKYFIIAILFTRKSSRIKRYFKKGIASLMKNPKYKNTVSDMHLIIDEQNISTDAEYTLDGYLNQHLTVVNPLCNHFDVIYSDSKNHALIQLIDFISNTFYRNIEKHDRTSIQNIQLLQNNLCGGRFFDFSTNHDTKLLLDE